MFRCELYQKFNLIHRNVFTNNIKISVEGKGKKGLHPSGSEEVQREVNK